MNTKQKWILRISIIANVIFGTLLLMNYTAHSNNLGVLKEDVKIGVFNDDKTNTLFTLPKGLTVKDVSERGLGAVGQFENNRFEIIITTERDLIDYSTSKKSLMTFGNYYSADSKN